MLTPIQSGQIQAKQTSGVEPLLAVNQVNKRDLRRHLFERPSQGGIHKSLYQQVTRLVSNLLSQIMGREPSRADQQGQTAALSHFAQGRAENAPREVRGIADRMPRLVDPENPFPNRDMVFLGEAKDYPEAVIAIEYGENTKPVFYEGNQVIARSLYLDSTRPFLDGQLILADGSRLPIHIRIITAV